MFKKIKEFLALNALVKKRSVGMQKKLMLYWISMILVIFMVVIILLSVVGTFSKEDKQLHEVMELYLKNTKDQLESHVDNLTAKSLYLSHELSREIEFVLTKEGIDFQDINDNPKSLFQIQEAMYPFVASILQASDCNGAYAILNATVNSTLDNAEYSKSGIYLRYSNLSESNPVTPTVVYFRGIPDIALQKNLELHNRWNLEFNINQIPDFKYLCEGGIDRPEKSYYWSKRIDIRDTWESSMLLLTPIVGSNGEIYGACGIEISALYFQLSYPVAKGEFGSVVTALAPIEDGRLKLSEGMVGGVSGTYLNPQNNLSIHQGHYFNEYNIGSERYIGLHQIIPISKNEKDDTVWAIAVLVPQESYTTYKADIKQSWILFALFLLIILLAFSFFMSKRFVRPIIESLKRFQQDEILGQNMSSGISEVDELAQFLNDRARNKRLEQGELPPNIQELFDQFIEREHLLTEAERNILRYYIDGHEISEIPELAFISMSTVRKHNRNIYEKLRVSSRNELMLYIDLLRRCGRLEELFD